MHFKKHLDCKQKMFSLQMLFAPSSMPIVHNHQGLLLSTAVATHVPSGR